MTCMQDAPKLPRDRLRFLEAAQEFLGASNPALHATTVSRPVHILAIRGKSGRGSGAIDKAVRSDNAPQRTSPCPSQPICRALPILSLADEFEIEMSEAQAQSYQALMQGPIGSYRRLEELPEFRPPVKYPRTPGYRPAAKDNPYNAWYWRCHIEGAPSGILKGYTLGIKDPICVAGVPLINGSRTLEGFIPDIDATVVTRILDAGGTIVGKTNTEDCSRSPAADTRALPVRCAIRTSPRTSPGGSSGGSAAAVAAGDVKMALGADQAGSIRMPRVAVRRGRPQANIRARSLHRHRHDRDDLDHVGPLSTVRIPPGSCRRSPAPIRSIRVSAASFPKTTSAITCRRSTAA